MKQELSLDECCTEIVMFEQRRM